MARKNRSFLFLLVLLSLALLLFTACSKESSEGEDAGAAASNEPIVFSDPVFESLLKAELGLETITPADLEEFTAVQIAADEFLFLTGPDRPDQSIILFGDDAFEYEGTRYTGYGTMQSLADLQYFPNLTRLRITLQPDIDPTTIPNIGNLVQLNWHQSNLTEVSFLTAAENLTMLSMSNNAITDISGLAQCTKLEYLSLDFNHIADLTPIAGLTALEEINFYSNELSDLSPLGNLAALTSIGLYNNKISDISVLAGLSNLTYIELIDNQITDVSPLANFPASTQIRLTGNPLQNISVLSHIENLEF